jgi:DNA-binding IclR family transcriptional regulator
MVEEYKRFVSAGTPRSRTWLGLEHQLAEIRRTGVCVTTGELDPDSIGIGVPVFTDQQVAACLSLAGPRTRFPVRRVRETAALLRSAANDLEERWTGAPVPEPETLQVRA